MFDMARVQVSRNEMIDSLLAENIGAALHFWPLHMMPYYRETYGYKPDDLPVARGVGESVMSLPLTPQMSQRDAQDVVEAVTKVVETFRR